jgi:polyisoprenoid-binding protein YceI
MKTKAIALLTLCCLTLPAWAQEHTIKIVPANARITFNIGHLLSTVDGSFKDFEGQLVYDAANPAHSSVSWDVKVASVDTANSKRDHHLATADYFNAEKYPSMSFRSSSVRSVDKTHLSVTGQFTMRGVTKVITVPIDVNGAGFDSDFTIIRSQYGFTAGSPVVGDKVDVHLHLGTHAVWFGK